MSGRNLLKL